MQHIVSLNPAASTRPQLYVCGWLIRNQLATQHMVSLSQAASAAKLIIHRQI